MITESEPLPVEHPEGKGRERQALGEEGGGEERASTERWGGRGNSCGIGFNQIRQELFVMDVGYEAQSSAVGGPSEWMVLVLELMVRSWSVLWFLLPCVQP